ncbi:hypothetical protein ACFL1E_07365 [Candidatus Omnitrophota bacterium]
MKEVYILGAGASRELKFYSTKTNGATKESKRQLHKILGPLSSGFFYYTNEFMKEIKKFDHFGVDIKISEWLEKFIVSYYFGKNRVKTSMQELLENEEKSKGINIEELYVAIEDRIQEINQTQIESLTTEEVEIFVGQRDLLRYIHQVFSTISYYCYSIYHRILARYLANKGGDIITFNWDILFEEEMFDTDRWDYSDGYGFKPKDFVDKNKLMGLNNYVYQIKNTPSSNVILKPHGSLNWFIITIIEIRSFF